MGSTPASRIVGARMTDRVLGWRGWWFVALTVNVALLLGCSAVRCFASDATALATTIHDDSFYYLMPAFRFAEHGVWTFDGEHPTFGVQPLFAWFLTGLAAFFDDRVSFFRAALWADYALFAATAVAIALLLRRWLQPLGEFRANLAALIGSHALLLDARLVHGYTTLKENALYSLLLVLSLIAAQRARERRSYQTLLVAGLALGLAVSCRITPSTLLIAIATLLFTLHGWSKERLLALATGVAAAIAPWALHAWFVHGRLLPTSGAVKMHEFRAAWRHGVLAERLTPLLSEVGPYLRDAFAYSLGLPSSFTLPQGGTTTSFISLAVPFLFLGLLFAWHRRHVLRAVPATRLVPLLLLAATVGTAWNPIVLWIERLVEVRYYYTWYLPVLLALLAALAVTVRAEPEWTVRTQSLLCAGLACAFVILGVLTFPPLSRIDPLDARSPGWSKSAAEIALRANEQLAPEARIGSYNAGLVGFLSHSTVINFDGLANDDIVAARGRGRTLLEYAQENEIEFLIDPLRPTGWFGNPFDRVALVDAVPFHFDALAGQAGYYDGYFLLRLVDERFPDFEPTLRASGVEVVPWLDSDPLGRGPAWRCFRLTPSEGVAPLLVFRTLRSFERMEFFAGIPGVVANGGELVVRDEVGRELHRSTPHAPQHWTIDCAGADLLRVTLEPGRELPAPSLWLTNVAFGWASASQEGFSGFVPYGEGCTIVSGNSPPHLMVESQDDSGVRYVVTNGPPSSAGTLAIGSAPLSKVLPGG